MRGHPALLFILLLINSLSCLQFIFEPGVQKCFYEEATSDTHVVVYYESHDQFENKQTIQVKVFAANTTIVHTTVIKKRKGKFSLVPHLGGQLRFCYTYGAKGYVYSTAGVRMTIRHSIGAKEIKTKGLVKQDDLRGIQKATRGLYKDVQQFVKSTVMKHDELDTLMDHLNVISGRTNMVISVQVLLVMLVGVYQVYSLRLFFIAKHIKN